MFSKTIGKTISKTIAAGPSLFSVVLACAASFSQATLSQATLSQATLSQTTLSQTTPGQPTPGEATPGEDKPAALSAAAGLEFPVVLRQNVAAGATPVGTKVQAKLAVATLVNGVVVPQYAIFSGEVAESVAKSATGPSRLAIRMDSAQWKNRSAPMVLAPKVYLTAWYYPAAPPTGQGIPSVPPEDARNSRPGSGSGGYPGERNSNSPPFPRADMGKIPLPASDVLKHRALMKNVESSRNSDGAVTLTSKQSNIKLDKTTTYVLAAGDLAAGPG
jgi:hypothetical protein